MGWWLMLVTGFVDQRNELKLGTDVLQTTTSQGGEGEEVLKKDFKAASSSETFFFFLISGPQLIKFWVGG